MEELQNQLEDTKDAFETGVKEILKDELGVSDEQVEDAMSILGLQWMDLLNPASLSQLVTQLTGTEDACSLLMSEEFTNIMQNTDELVQSLSETLGISKDEWVALQNQLAELTADFNETVDMADGGVQEIAPQTDATITSQDTTVMAATVQMTHTTEETQNVQPEEETEDADVAEEYNDEDADEEVREEAVEESVLNKRDSPFMKRPTNLFACFKFSNAKDICSVYRLLGVNAKYCKIYYNDKNWYIIVDKKKCTYNYCTNLYFLFTEYNGIDRDRYGAYLAEHCTPVSIEQVRLFAL